MAGRSFLGAGPFYSSAMRFDIRNNIAQIQAQFAARKREMDRAVRDGMRDAKEPLRAALNAELASAFRVRSSRFERTWRVSVSKAPSVVITNLMKGFGLHVTGGTIGPRSGRALLIPINTYLGARIGTKKFYSMIDWLMREKLTVIKGNILYVKPVMNTSRRGGVAIGTRVNKQFRRRFQGTKRRPSGFGLTLNDEGLTPIAVIRKSVTMRRRFDMNAIVTSKLMPLIVKNIANRVQLNRVE